MEIPEKDFSILLKPRSLLAPFDLDLPLPASAEVSLLPLALDLPLSEVGADLGGVVGAEVPLVGGGAVLVVPVVPDVAPLAACALWTFCLSSEMARCDVDQQRRVGILVRRTEQVIVLARVKKPLGDLDPILQSWTGSGPLLVGEGVSLLKDAAHEAQLTTRHLLYSWPNVSSHHLKDDSGFEDTNLGTTLQLGSWPIASLWPLTKYRTMSCQSCA